MNNNEFLNVFDGIFNNKNNKYQNDYDYQDDEKPTALKTNIYKDKVSNRYIVIAEIKDCKKTDICISYDSNERILSIKAKIGKHLNFPLTNISTLNEQIKYEERETTIHFKYANILFDEIYQNIENSYLYLYIPTIK